MPSMKPLSEIEVLFFKAEKNSYQPIQKYLVDGFPYFDSNKISYHAYEKDFIFKTYKEVVVAGIFWTKKLFGANSINDIFIKHLEYGRKKQWFNVQLVQTGNGVIIDGEKFNPYINISYSYNTVTKIKFEIGFYRYACSNGLVTDSKELSKMEIKPENIFDFPFWLNPCLITFLTKRLETQFKILRNTSLKSVEIQNWIEKKVSKKWKISNGVIWKNIEKDGENAYALLNILTDSASNFDHDLVEVELLNFIDSRHEAEDGSSNSERANRQRKVGKFLESLIEEINKVNQIENGVIDINSPEFKINDDNIGLFDNLKVKESYKLDIGTVKF
jgi:hypothetical protein